MRENRPLLSIVTPTFNRRDIVGRSIDSALDWLEQIGGGEVIVVDDRSTDGTAEMIAARYDRQMAAGRLVLERLEHNQGVTAAKNAGARRARGEWIVFLDSDDRLHAESLPAVLRELESAGATPAIFFRCDDQADGRLIGAPQAKRTTASVRDLLHGWRWGECLPVVRKEAILACPYVDNLRGYEGVAYGRMIQRFGPILVSPIVARSYDTSGTDRITARANLRSDRCRDARALAILAREFGGSLPVVPRLRLWLSRARARLDCWRSSSSTR